MSPVRLEPASPGCCLVSLLLLPFNIFFIPFRLLISPRQQRYGRPGRYRWM